MNATLTSAKKLFVECRVVAAREVVVLPDGQIIAVGVKPLPWRRSADPAQVQRALGQ